MGRLTGLRINSNVVRLARPSHPQRAPSLLLLLLVEVAAGGACLVLGAERWPDFEVEELSCTFGVSREAPDGAGAVGGEAAAHESSGCADKCWVVLRIQPPPHKLRLFSKPYSKATPDNTFPDVGCTVLRMDCYAEELHPNRIKQCHSAAKDACSREAPGKSVKRTYEIAEDEKRWVWPALSSILQKASKKKKNGKGDDTTMFFRCQGLSKLLRKNRFLCFFCDLPHKQEEKMTSMNAKRAPPNGRRRDVCAGTRRESEWAASWSIKG